MKYRVALTARAQRDRDTAFHWYTENYSQQFAVRWYNGLTRAIGSLANQPIRCARAHESDQFAFDVRELRFGGRLHKHRILFTMRDDLILVLHIRHSAQRDLTEEDL